MDGEDEDLYDEFGNYIGPGALRLHTSAALYYCQQRARVARAQSSTAMRKAMRR